MHRSNRNALTIVVLALLVTVVPDASWASATAPAVPPRVDLTIGSRAKILGGGATAKIPIRGICTSGADVIEAFVYITQDGFTSQWGFIPLVCDDVAHWWLVRVPALDQPFHPGTASASAYAQVMDPNTGETGEDSPFRDITMFA